MKKINYLELIINVFEQLQLNDEFSEDRFSEEILIEYSEISKTNSITKKRFISNCENEVETLKNHIIDKVKLEKSIENKSKTLLDILGTSIVRTPIIDVNTFLVNITPLVKTAKSTICYNEIESIASVFVNMDLDEANISKDSLTSSIGEKVNLSTIDNPNSNPLDNLPDGVYNYFKNKLVDPKKYLSEIDLDKFLFHAFILKKPLDIKIRFQRVKTKGAIRKIFYDFYKEEQSPYGEQDDYVKLLTDYFDGYDFKNIKSNFSK